MATSTPATHSVPRAPYTLAVMRALAPSFAGAVSKHPDGNSIIVDKAFAQHDAYEHALRQFLPNIVVVPADDKHPDGNFVEDTHVAVGRVVVATQPGHESRRGEVPPMAEAVRKAVGEKGWYYNVADAGEAYLDGGDVLFTGVHLLIGLSDRTNPAGAAFLERAVKDHYPSLSVVTVDLRAQPTLHLKCVVTALSHTVLIFADDEPGRFAFAQLPESVRAAYEVVWVPDQVASNVLAFPDGKGGLLGVVAQGGFPASEKILDEAIATRFGKDVPVVKLDMSEFIKADGALTCCSLLFNC
ncbi:hypothetical protein AMAG_10231 [Allomyces macrogynus ATCC 38327]|uniref:RNA-editing substrate-binding complex 5 protein domain-containing protein n=1 Tax=Allomyces macrogynus (strain ATCC 38327) TaxID=578462 RepID=A0A0L0SUC0_ALLM3|nr:hypothetical protein AMAG_10231 [Allomyces macrogynus ATCC 38327]|eukprot:KNE65944.1 hypothetical protein AMAG_10231 [Allomyces macrogynus ATCC 38327]